MFAGSFTPRLVSTILLACVAASAVSDATAHASPTATASHLLQSAFTDALASGSAHEVESEVIGQHWFKMSDDVSLHDGRQQITRSDGVDAHVLLIGPTAYVSGNERTLVSYFGLTQSVAQTVGARWIRIPSSDHGWYPTVAADATLSSALSQVKPSGNLAELSQSELYGKSVIGIRGSMPVGFKGGGTDTVFVTRSTHPMLVAAIFSHSDQTVTSRFSSWGEAVTVTAPTSWIASSKL